MLWGVLGSSRVKLVQYERGASSLPLQITILKAIFSETDCINFNPALYKLIQNRNVLFFILLRVAMWYKAHKFSQQAIPIRVETVGLMHFFRDANEVHCVELVSIKVMEANSTQIKAFHSVLHVCSNRPRRPFVHPGPIPENMSSWTKEFNPVQEICFKPMKCKHIHSLKALFNNFSL